MLFVSENDPNGALFEENSNTSLLVWLTNHGLHIELQKKLKRGR